MLSASPPDTVEVHLPFLKKKSKQTNKQKVLLSPQYSFVFRKGATDFSHVSKEVILHYNLLI